jgi:glucose/arabinose dehydrogenase
MQTHRATRRRLAGLIGSTILVFAIGSSGIGSSGASAAAVSLTPFVSGLDSPVFVTSANDGTGRLFVVEQTGKIRVIKNGVLLATPFLDISALVSGATEQGLLGLAFHPNFKTDGRFYVDYTDRSGNTAVVQYRVSPKPDQAMHSSARRIISVAQPFDNHNGGMLAFGPDGDLYIGLGDGGSSGDPGNRAQNLNVLLGKILRINVNGSVGARHYLIPSSNPFVGRTGRDEIWSYGLRNPWRFSFDKLTGDLWIGDVGQNRYEEVDRAKVNSSSTSRGRGANFGWRQLEGSHCFQPATGCSRSGKVIPAIEYNHDGGNCSVTGGYVYRGSLVPALAGKYVFGDFCSGKIWTFPIGASWPVTASLLMDTDLSISSFGQDQAGGLYVVDRGGSIYKLTTP